MKEEVTTYKGTKNRTEARLFAFKTLYAGSFHEGVQEVTMPEGFVNFHMDEEYAHELIQNVETHVQELDEKIQEYSKKRKIERLPIVDITLLRLGLAEMIFMKEQLAPSICINEAVELAKEFGTDSSYKLVNAILDSIAKDINASSQAQKEE